MHVMSFSSPAVHTVRLETWCSSVSACRRTAFRPGLQPSQRGRAAQGGSACWRSHRQARLWKFTVQGSKYGPGSEALLSNTAQN